MLDPLKKRILAIVFLLLVVLSYFALKKIWLKKMKPAGFDRDLTNRWQGYLTT